MSFFSGLLFICVSGLFQYVVMTNQKIVFFIAAVLCSAIGGILLSNSFNSEARWLKKISPRIESIINQVAVIASQVSQIVNGQNRECNLVIAQLSQILPHIYAIAADLGTLCGKNFDPHTLIKTQGAIRDLLSVIECENTISLADKTKFRQTLSEIYSKIPIDILSESVSCPYCNEKNEIKIGAQFPYSAMPICNHCGEKFHANRQKDGRVITRQRG